MNAPMVPRSSLSTAAAFALALGCAAPPDAAPDLHWTDASYSSGFRRIVESPSLCLDCIRLEERVTMGESDGPGFLGEALYVARDGLGHYWVQHPGALKVFDDAGRFLREVGRPGRGPMEFQRPWPVYADQAGRVHVFDALNARLSVIGPDFRLVEERPLPGNIRAVAPLGTDGSRYVANLWLPTAERMAMPLHTIEGPGGAILHSFGHSGESGPIDERTASRILAADGAGHVFSARETEFEIEVWTEDGVRVAGYVLPSFNSRPPAPGPISRDNPFPNTIRGLHVDDAERLWVISWRPRPDWLSAMEEQVLPNGNVTLRLRPGRTTASLWMSRIEVVDLKTATIVARSDRDALVARFLDGDAVWGPRYLEDGSPLVAVWGVGLEERP